MNRQSIIKTESKRDKVNQSFISRPTCNANERVQQCMETNTASTDAFDFSYDCSSGPIRTGFNDIQTKLRLGQINDQYEHEANRVAEQVIRVPEPGTYSVTNLPRLNNSIQRKCSSCEESELVLRKN